MPWTAAIQEIRSGNELSIEALCAAVTESARAQLYQSVEPQAVDDHLQEILIIVLAAVRNGELRDPECLMGFVRTVTRRQVTVHIRRNIVQRRRLISAESSRTPAAPVEESPEARFRMQQRVALVGFVLDLLCSRDREILTRFYYDEQNSEQICREMRLTTTQFRLYKSRALAKCSELRHDALRVHPVPQFTKPLRIA